MRVTAWLTRLSDGINWIALRGAVLAVLVMVAAAAYQVVARYIFDSPPIWTEELSRRAMVWAGMLGASVAFHERSDPTLFPGMLALTNGIGKLFAVVRTAGVLLFAFPVLYYSVFGPGMDITRGFLGRSLGRQGEMIAVPMIWFTAAVPVAFAIIVVHVAASLAQHLSTRERLEPANQEESPI